jgi:hypothetical protein
VSTWEKYSNAFLAMFFLLGKTNPLQNKITTFQQVKDAKQLEQVLQSHQQPKSSGMETVLLTDLKCDTLARRINR